jgi:hypothetical protein
MTMTQITQDSVQLKNVKVSHHMSEETTAFTATLYINGKRAAYVKNTGQGGDNWPRFIDRNVETAFHAMCKALPPQQLPDTTSVNAEGLTICCDALTTFHDETECCKVCWKELMAPYPMTYDSFIGDLLDEWMQADDWKKACRKGLVFRLQSHLPRQYAITKGKYAPDLAEYIRTQYGEDLIEIVNERFL